MVLRRIFGPKRDEVTRGWRKLHNDNDQFKEDEMYRACSTNGEKRKACMFLVGKLERRRPLGRPRSRWVDNVKMDLGEIGWCGIN
jgi:hypothetical protein